VRKIAITKHSSGSGLYLVAESIDCGGKGTIVDAIKAHLRSEGKTFIDFRELWPKDDSPAELNKINMLSLIYGTTNVIPEFQTFSGYFDIARKPLDAIFICEPTFANTGLLIRTKKTHNVYGRHVTAKETAGLYADDRHELLPKLILPALEAGIDVFCERNVCSSIVYQSSMDDALSVDYILGREGNVFALKHSPDVYVICDLSADTAMERKNARTEKQDNCRFEVPEFQRRIEQKYRSDWLRGLLEGYGSKVVYVNTDRPTTLDDTRRAAVDVLLRYRKGVLVSGERFNF
jgi:thymidylate kinase